jgi:hypothetical protein
VRQFGGGRRAQVQQLLGCHEAAGKLAALGRRRQELLGQRAALVAAAAPLELRLARARGAAGGRLRSLRSSIDELGCSLEQLLRDEAQAQASRPASRASETAVGTGAAAPATVLLSEVDERRRAALAATARLLRGLQGQEAALQRQAAAGGEQAALAPGEAEELRLLLEQLESLDVQLQYMAAEVAECEQVRAPGCGAPRCCGSCGCCGCCQCTRLQESCDRMVHSGLLHSWCG